MRCATTAHVRKRPVATSSTVCNVAEGNGDVTEVDGDVVEVDGDDRRGWRHHRS